MCFSLQRRAIFPHLKFKKWSDHGVFCTFWIANVLSQRRAIFGQLNFKKCSGNGVFPRFWLWNVLLATAACNFSTWTSKSAPTVIFLAFLLENALRATAACNFSCLLWAATSAPAALASLLFDPADTQIIEKTQRFATFLTFRAGGSSFYWLSHNCIFFLLTLLLFSAFHLLTLLLCSAFQLSILSEVSLLNFLW